MPAIDYLCKELDKLGERIKVLSGGKISKGDLLIFTIIGIVIVGFSVSVYSRDALVFFTFVLAVATILNIGITQGLLRQSKEASELSRDAGLYNYAISYLTSFIKTLEKDKWRELFTRTARKTIYDALEDLLSPETAKKIKEFRDIVDAELTEKTLEIITTKQNLKE